MDASLGKTFSGLQTIADRRRGSVLQIEQACLWHRCRLQCETNSQERLTSPFFQFQASSSSRAGPLQEYKASRTALADLHAGDLVFSRNRPAEASRVRPTGQPGIEPRCIRRQLVIAALVELTVLFYVW